MPPRAIRVFAKIALSALVAGVASLFVTLLVSRLNFPAFNTSNVLASLASLSQLLALGVIAVSVALVYARPNAADDNPIENKMGAFQVIRWRRSAIAPMAQNFGKFLLPTGVGLFVAASLAVPLAATKLYLHGISVDQAFRTQFLGRTTQSWLPADMAYPDLPSFYPSGWFLIGGRIADVLSIPGWEMVRPWSIVSIAMAAGAVCALWQAIASPLRATAATLASVLVILTLGSPEPYGAIVAIAIPPLAILAWHSLAPTFPSGGRSATIAVTIALGISACIYTLYTALLALTVILMAAVQLFQATGSRGKTIARLATMGLGSAAIALLAWAPYLVERLSNRASSSGAAYHYLPAASSTFALPMLAATPIGVLCLAGMVWIAVRIRTSRRAQSWAFVLCACYLWVGVSLLLTAVGTTLLSFRVDLIITVVLAVAGTAAIADVVAHPRYRRIDTRAYGAAAVATVLALGAAQAITATLKTDIDIAYTDVDGNGERADRVAAGAARFYPQIDRVILDTSGEPRADTVVLATADGFLALYPYLAYQAISPHYANPLGLYKERRLLISSWESITDPDDFLASLESTSWRAPDVLVATTTASGYQFKLLRDTFPNDPNIAIDTITIPSSAISEKHFDIAQVGPFSVLVRK